jgi:hypothetical protein
MDMKFPSDADIARAFWASILMYALGVSLVLLIVRWFGLRIAPTGCETRDAAKTAELPRSQFTLRALLEWTTAVAIVLGLGAYASRGRWRDFTEFITRPGLMVVGVGSLFALAAVWAALGTRWPVPRYLALALTWGALIAIRPSFSDYSAWASAGHYSVQAVWLLGSLWVIRLAGYRLLWRGRVT